MSKTRTGPGLADIPATYDAAAKVGGDLGLGLMDAADALAEFITKCATPLTIGLQGDWGSGKTSLMNFIDAKLALKTRGQRSNKRRLYPSIKFNTWAYSQFNREDDLPFSLLANLTAQLRAKIKEENTRIDAAAADAVKGAMKRFGNVLFSVASTATAAYTGGAVDLSRMRGAVERMFGDEDDAVDQARLFAQLREAFAELVEQFLLATGAEKLVIYVDDLDRLKPVRAIEVLEVMKNFIDVEGCVYVLAIDYDVVLQGLAERKGYELAEGDGKSFFDKIIQVPFRMPTSVYKITDYLIARLDEAGLASQEWHFKRMWVTPPGDANLDALIRHSVGTNPRSIKRLVNCTGPA